jgi:hypothetical protein
MDYSKNTTKQLKQICRDRGIKGFSDKNKDTLIEMIKATDSISDSISEAKVVKTTPTSKNIVIDYNSDTYNLESPNSKLNVEQEGDSYQTSGLTKNKPVVNLSYDNIKIITNNIHECYVILQSIRKTTTLIDLSKLDWDYTKWNVTITSTKILPDWANILNCLLNLIDKFNTPLKIEDLDKIITLNDKRGWGGERPREVYYKLGFPLYTSKTKKSLKNCERLFECPFPICNINPKRKAVVASDHKEKKCFTCGTKEGETNIFGNICNFEKGHFEPHIIGGDVTAGNQCKWCNSFYKDKITWNTGTGKPTFNSYAILRDAPKNEIIANLKKLGFTAKDLE